MFFLCDSPPCIKCCIKLEDGLESMPPVSAGPDVFSTHESEYGPPGGRQSGGCLRIPQYALHLEFALKSGLKILLASIMSTTRQSSGDKASSSLRVTPDASPFLRRFTQRTR